jgi:O-antigen/teichoic acid export membrane protein
MGFAAPLLVISIAGQLSFSADVVIVGAFSGAVAATWVTVGARLPGLALSLAHLAADVMFPFYVEEAHAQKPADSSALHRGLELAGFLGGAAFVALLLARQGLLHTWVGDANPVAVAVMSLYCLAWLIHMPAHILTLLLIARGRHGALVPVIVIEALANLGLSIALVQVMGPVGVAVASFAAVAVSNVILIPTLAHRATGISLTVAIWSAGRGWLLGALAAVSGYLMAEAASPSPILGLAIQVATTAALSTAWLWFVWRAPSVARVAAA